jgi:hypothetical protein
MIQGASRAVLPGSSGGKVHPVTVLRPSDCHLSFCITSIYTTPRRMLFSGAGYPFGA